MAPRLIVGGVIDAATDLYVGRVGDEALFRNLAESRSTFVHGPRCMGKSSLAHHVGGLVEDPAVAREWVDTAGDGPTARAALDRLVDMPVRLATVDFDRDRVGAEGDEHPAAQLVTGVWRDLRRRGHAHGPVPDPRVPLLDGLLALAEADPTRRLTVVVDEFDHLRRTPAAGAKLVREMRATLQTLRRDPELRSRLTLCILSLRQTEDLFSAVAGTDGGPIELPMERIALGPFEISDVTRRQLAEGLASYDPGNADNLARLVLEVSGGYPQLCIDLLKRVLELGVRYGPDTRSVLLSQVRWYRHESDPSRRRFFGMIEGFIREDPRRGIQALDAYRRVLVDPRDGSSTVRHDATDPGQALLDVAGLTRVADGAVRPFGPFLAEYFDLRWVDEVRRGLQAQRAVSSRPTQRTRLSDRRLCVLITGGTIGMVERHGLVRPPDSGEELADEYQEVSDLFDVRWEPLANLDSANVGPDHWGAFARAIYDRRHDYDGFVIAHGTDTLTFSASAVAFALGANLNRPVVFTGSQSTVDVLHGDARSNLLRACLVAASPERPELLPEVVVAFNEHVLRAVRAVKRDDRRFDAFESPAYPPLGTVTEEVSLQHSVIRRIAATPGPMELSDSFATGILVVAQSPAMYLAAFDAALKDDDPPVRGVVIQSLGAGNVPTEGDASLLPLIARASERDVPVLLAGQYPVHPANLGRYDPPRQAIAAGAIPVANMTTSALVAKFSWVLARLANVSGSDLTEGVRQYMLASLVGEVDQRDSDELARIDLRR
jgi:L-asparaginase